MTSEPINKENGLLESHVLKTDYQEIDSMRYATELGL